MRSRSEVSSTQFKWFKSPIFLWLVLLGISADCARAQKCDAIPHVTVPEKDLPTSADARLAGYAPPIPPNLPPGSFCDALNLYYKDSPRHLEKARFCALADFGLFSKNDAPVGAPAAQNETFSGTDALTLAMIYANGQGVTRSLPLARQFVCQDGDGVATPSNDQMLGEFDSAVESNGRFDACGDGGGGFGRSFNYQCLGLQDEVAAEEIRQREGSILAGSSPAQRASFTALKADYDEFQSAYSDMEGTQCEGGTGCGPILEQDELAVDRSWLAALSAIQAGLPPCSAIGASAFAQLDSNLNQQYRQALKGNYMDVNAGDQMKSMAPLVRAADRAWLKYRDAWVSFGQLRWPAVPADQWRAWQTKEWIVLLTM
jgi:Lysozyme inhibitor LprI